MAEPKPTIESLMNPHKVPKAKTMLRGEGKRMAIQLMDPSHRVISQSAIQQREARKLFAKMDDDGGGTLSTKEMLSGLKKYHPDKKVTKNPEEIARIMKACDPDDDGEITVIEFLHAVNSGAITFVPDVMAEGITAEKITTIDDSLKFQNMVKKRFAEYLDVIASLAHLPDVTIIDLWRVYVLLEDRETQSLTVEGLRRMRAFANKRTHFLEQLQRTFAAAFNPLREGMSFEEFAMMFSCLSPQAPAELKAIMMFLVADCDEDGVLDISDLYCTILDHLPLGVGGHGDEGDSDDEEDGGFSFGGISLGAKQMKKMEKKMAKQMGKDAAEAGGEEDAKAAKKKAMSPEERKMVFVGATAVLTALDMRGVNPSGGPGLLTRGQLGELLEGAKIGKSTQMYEEAMHEYDDLMKPECGRRTEQFTGGKTAVTVDQFRACECLHHWVERKCEMSISALTRKELALTLAHRMLGELMFDHVVLDMNDVFCHVEEVSWLADHVDAFHPHFSMYAPSFHHVWHDWCCERNLEKALNSYEAEHNADAREELRLMYKTVKKETKTANWARSLRVLVKKVKVVLKEDVGDEDKEEINPLSDDYDPEMQESTPSPVSTASPRTQLLDSMISPRAGDSPRALTQDVQKNDVPHRFRVRNAHRAVVEKGLVDIAGITESGEQKWYMKLYRFATYYFDEFKANHVPFNNSIDIIDGQFGESITLVFNFMRDAFILNCYLSIFWFLVVAAPWFVVNDGTFHKNLSFIVREKGNNNSLALVDWPSDMWENIGCHCVARSQWGSSDKTSDRYRSDVGEEMCNKDDRAVGAENSDAVADSVGNCGNSCGKTCGDRCDNRTRWYHSADARTECLPTWGGEVMFKRTKLPMFYEAFHKSNGVQDGNRNGMGNMMIPYYLALCFSIVYSMKYIVGNISDRIRGKRGASNKGTAKAYMISNLVVAGSNQSYTQEEGIDHGFQAFDRHARDTLDLIQFGEKTSGLFASGGLAVAGYLAKFAFFIILMFNASAIFWALQTPRLDDLERALALTVIQVVPQQLMMVITHLTAGAGGTFKEMSLLFNRLWYLSVFNLLLTFIELFDVTGASDAQAKYFAQFENYAMNQVGAAATSLNGTNATALSWEEMIAQAQAASASAQAKAESSSSMLDGAMAGMAQIAGMQTVTSLCARLNFELDERKQCNGSLGHLNVTLEAATICKKQGLKLTPYKNATTGKLSMFANKCTKKKPVKKMYTTGICSQLAENPDKLGADKLRQALEKAGCVEIKPRKAHMCVETYVGDLVVTMLVMDIIKLLVGSAATHLLTKYVSNKKTYFKPKDPGVLCINICYIQSLVWVGITASPFVPFIGVVSIGCNIACNAFIFEQHYLPPKHPWGAAESSGFIDRKLLLNFYISVVPFCMYMFSVSKCGPFEGKRVSNILEDSIQQSGNAVLKAIFRVIMEFGASAPVLLLVLMMQMVKFHFSDAARQGLARDLLDLNAEMVAERQATGELMSRADSSYDDEEAGLALISSKYIHHTIKKVDKQFNPHVTPHEVEDVI